MSQMKEKDDEIARLKAELAKTKKGKTVEPTDETVEDKVEE